LAGCTRASLSPLARLVWCGFPRALGGNWIMCSELVAGGPTITGVARHRELKLPHPRHSSNTGLPKASALGYADTKRTRAALPYCRPDRSGKSKAQPQDSAWMSRRSPPAPRKCVARNGARRAASRSLIERSFASCVVDSPAQRTAAGTTKANGVRSGQIRRRIGTGRSAINSAPSTGSLRASGETHHGGAPI
jgi:hypothetical protein